MFEFVKQFHRIRNFLPYNTFPKMHFSIFYEVVKKKSITFLKNNQKLDKMKTELKQKMKIYKDRRRSDSCVLIVG